MKKSKSKSKRRDRSRSRSNDSKSKRQKPQSVAPAEKEKTKTKAAPRKTRWQANDEKDTSKKDQPSEAIPKKEKSGPLPRIKDFLHNKEKIVAILFETVTGAALQELIPDYLKKRPVEELKKLCLEQIKSMPDEMVLQIIAGELESSNKDEKKSGKEQNLKLEQPNPPKESAEEKTTSAAEKKPEVASDHKEKAVNIPSEPQTVDTKEKEKEATQDEENQIPLIIKDEVAKDLILPERDAELLELEMRARAIRSLLKAKSQAANEDETASKHGD